MPEEIITVETLDMLDIKAVDTGSYIELYRAYCVEEFEKGNYNIELFSEFVARMNS